MNLEEVQVGDTLIWNGRHIANAQIVKVDRLTKTQIIISGGTRFRKSDGYIADSTWHSVNLTIPKEGEIEKIQEAQLHRNLVNRISDACQINKLRAMSLDTLQRLNEVLENQ